jgi:hypothetical protein
MEARGDFFEPLQPAIFDFGSRGEESFEDRVKI